MPADEISTAALRLARVAIGISQREAALACGVGWRTMQRVELDEPATADIRNKIEAEWKRRGVVFLKKDASGWGIRVPKQAGPIGHNALKALRIGLGISVDKAARLAGVTARTLNLLESDDEAPLSDREKMTHAYSKAGVKFLPPGPTSGWGFRIPEALSPESGRILIRPSRKTLAKTASTTPKAAKPKRKATKPTASKGRPPSAKDIVS